MSTSPLLDDALRTTPGGFALRLGLPWIRSLPLSSVTSLSVCIDGEPIAELRVEAPTPAAENRTVEASALHGEPGWWCLQDRLTLLADSPLSAGAHEVSVSIELLVPYLSGGPSAPLVLPLTFSKELLPDAAAPRHLTVTAPLPGFADPVRTSLPAGWELTASAFNWTPALLHGADALTLSSGIVESGLVSHVEVEAGQLWRSFPFCDDAESERIREGFEQAGGGISMVGLGLDDWLTPSARRDEDERLAFLLPQLRAAQRAGATGVRLPLGQAGQRLLSRLQPTLHKLDLVLFEEAQGPQRVSQPPQLAAFETIAELNDQRVRGLIDISMLMPSLPPTYLERLRSAGLPEDFVELLGTAWRDERTTSAARELLTSGKVPNSIHAIFMNLFVRFGDSDARDLREVMHLVGGIHLKFWDLDDTDSRISQPIRELASELVKSGFSGTLCSEWGGHEWLQHMDAFDMTSGHLDLACAALCAGAAHAPAILD